VTAYDAALALAPSGALVVKRHMAQLAAGENPGVLPLTDWLSKHPTDLPVRLHLANRYYAAGRFKEAAEQFSTITQRDPYSAAALSNLARTYLKLDDARALSTAEAAHRLAPDHTRILEVLGTAQSRFGQPDAGVETLSKALARQPDSARIRANYALALSRAGDRAMATTELRKAVAKDPKLALDPDVRALLAP
jgi:tetratricopeptide (TPR) repeat protein